MRITYLHQYFNTPRHAGGTRSYEMARRLVAAGHDVSMITSERSGQSFGMWKVTDEAGVRVHWLPVPYTNKMSYPQRLQAFFRFAWESSSRAASLPADVIFATSSPLTIAIPGIYAKRRLKAPMVFEVRDLWPRSAIAIGALKGRAPIAAARWLEKLAYDNSARIIALAPSIKLGICARDYPADRVHVIPNASDVAFFDVAEEAGKDFRAQYDWLLQRPMVLYAGTLGRVNHVEYLVDIASRVARLDPEIRFVISGSGVMEQAVREHARAIGVLDRNLFMLGERKKGEMPAIFSAATITTSTVVDNPLLWGDSANKVFDSFAAGRPIAINHGGWQEEVLRESGAGIVLPPADADMAARLLVKALHDDDYLSSARVAAKHLAQTRFNRDLLAIELEGILQSVVDEHRISGK